VGSAGFPAQDVDSTMRRGDNPVAESRTHN
jgi:hypothetical protein